MGRIASASIDGATLEPAPIRPEWIRAGTPLARCAELSRSADGTALTAVWECTAGEFDWHFAGDETVHILDGEVIVDEGEGPRALRPGDVAFFPAGSTSRWRVPAYVKKLAFCRDPVPRPVLRAVGLVRRLKGLIGARKATGALLSAG
jgi:uncharacterized cupin superfamily protein